MAKDAVKKRCVECRRTLGGTRGLAQWCPDCGGEMREVRYGRRRRRASGR